MATVPTTFTYSSGSVLTAAQLNTYLSAAVSFFLAVPTCELRQTVAQSLANTPTISQITFDTEDVDNDGMHSTVTNTSRVTAQTAGRYQVSGKVGFAANATGVRQTFYQVNGSTANASDTSTASVSGSTYAIPTVTKTIFLNVGDYVEIGVIQASGGSLNSAVTGADQPAFSVRWVGTT